MAGYVYRGTEHDVTKPKAAPAPARKGPGRPRTTVCGTSSGYQRHLLDGTPTCNPCRKAHAAYVAAYRAVKAGKKAKRQDPSGRTHGTNGGYYQHIRRGERPCFECCDAHRKYTNAGNARRRALKPCTGCQRPMARTHGSLPEGAVRHQAHGLCQACYMRERNHQ